MSLDAGRVGVRTDQVDIHGRVTSPSFLNELLEDLPEWTDMPVWVNGTEELLPSNNSVPVTSPILADIAYPDIRRDNQYFTYRESPTPVDGLAKIKSIKGNTLVWNQLVQNGNFANTSNWRAEFNATISASNNILSLTPSVQNGRVSQKFTYTANHKLLIMADVKLSSTLGTLDNVTLSAYAIDNRARVSTSHPVASTDWQKLYVFCYSTSANANNRFMFTDGRTSDWGTTQIRNFMAFDLTSMFGETKANELFASEQSQVGKGLLEFTSLFSLPYYAYNQGSFLSFMGNGIKTVGKNKFNLTRDIDVTIGGVTFKSNADNSITVNGTATANATITQFNGFTVPNIKKGESLIWSGSLNRPLSQAYLQLVYIGDETGQTYSFVSENNGSVSINATENMTLNGIYISCRSGNTFNNETFYPMLRYANTDSTFEPYTSSTTNLPVSTYFPTGMKSAGSVYDELTPTKATTRIGAVDMGSLTWRLGTYNEMYTTIEDVKKGVANVKPNILCTKYPTITFADRSQYSIPIITVVDDLSMIQIRNTGATDTEAFKQSLSGVYLYYELATPVELPTLSLSLGE